MKIGPWGKTGCFIDNFNKNKVQLNFQTSRLTLTIPLKNNCSWVIPKVLKVFLRCAQLWSTVTGVALINRVRWCGKTVHRNTEYLGKAST